MADRHQSSEQKRIILVEKDLTHTLPYTVFDKDERVTQAAIAEVKRFSEGLAHIKRAQEEQRPTPKTTAKASAASPILISQQAPS